MTTTMNTDYRTPDFAARLREAFRNPEAETDLGKAVARLRQPFQVGDGEKWLYEGFISAFSGLFDALRAIDDSIPPGLPLHLLDPAWIARAFHIPLEDFNWQGRPVVAAAPVTPEHDTPTVDDASYVSLAEAAKVIPGRASGKRVSINTLWRWCTRGVHGIRLRSVLVGGHRCTTRPWLEEFIEAITSAADPPERLGAPQVRTQRQRQSASDRAADELKAAWQRRRRRSTEGGAAPPS